jgi:hypothetical protein
LLFLSSAWSSACLPRPRIEDEREPAPRAAIPEEPLAVSAAPTQALTELGPLERRAAELRELYGERGLHVLVEAPFVVIGDEDRNEVERHAMYTVRWAVERLKRQFFARDPERIIDVWLFGTDESYFAWAKELFDDVPSTPYGYYSPASNALVMNISTGGGTLVHEIVHPYMETNFAECPSWFDEGLASLYEQSSEREGKIIGLTNWRLSALQQAIRRGTVPSTRRLTRTGERPFYDDDPGTNYAQARYLCYWLQEHGLLEDFYRDFVAAADEDLTGFATLSRIVDYEGEMDRFDAMWRKFVLGLRFG